MASSKPNVVRQCDPECIFVAISNEMDIIESLKSDEERDHQAIAEAIENARETISEIEMNLEWYKIKLNRLEIENREYL